MNYATQEQKGGVGQFAIPALIIGGIFLASRRGQDGNGGGGDGGGPGSEVPAGMAAVAGGISSVSVQQQAGMGQLEKAVQSSLIVELRFIGETTRDGVAIEWPYYLIVRIGHNTLFGWREAGRGGVPDFRDLNGNVVQMPWASTQINATRTGGITRMPTLRIPNDPGVTYDIRVQLRAQESDPSGSPNGTWMNVGSEFREDGAFIIASETTAPANVGGGVSSVTVAQGPGERLPLPSTRRQGLRISGRR